MLETGLRDKVIAEHGYFHEAANGHLCGVMGEYIWNEQRRPGKLAHNLE